MANAINTLYHSLCAMDRLTQSMSNLRMATGGERKRSYVEAFLEEEATKCSSTKKSTRLELARAINRKETLFQNMRKTKERVKKQMERLRELEAGYTAACAEVKRLRKLLR